MPEESTRPGAANFYQIRRPRIICDLKIWKDPTKSNLQMLQQWGDFACNAKDSEVKTDQKEAITLSQAKQVTG